MNQPSTVYYILGIIAFLYLALPHVFELFSTEHMTNADMLKKNSTYKVWEMFDEVPVEVPDVPAGPIPASNKKEVEAPIDAATYNAPQKELESDKLAADPNEENAPVDRALDTEVQIPSSNTKKPNTEERRKIIKKSVQIARPVPASSADHKKDTGIRGPRAPELDRSQPLPSHNESKTKQGSGVYPDIYGPELLEVPGSAEVDSSKPPPIDFVPAAEFPSGPLFPSPYLNDFSKMLKT
jgi:hypothetical protein